MDIEHSHHPVAVRLLYGCTMLWVVPVLLWVMVSASFAQTPAIPAPELKNGSVVTPRLTIQLDASGLPKQIEIKPDAAELPLEARSGKPSPEDLKWIGRGPQLRAPVRIEAAVDGKTAAVAVAQAAQPAARDGAVVCSSKLTAGPLQIALDLRYERDGALLGTVTYSGRGAVDGLEMVIEPDGLLDTIVVGPPVGDKPKACPAREFTLGADKGLLWGNSVKDSNSAGRAAPGVVKHLFLGSGDRGWTWLTDDDKGWLGDGNASTMTVERTEANTVAWRIKFVNAKTQLTAPQTVSFALVTHPATSKPLDHRAKAWLDWPADAVAAKAALSLQGRKDLAAKPAPALAADVAGPMEAFTPYALMEGPAGGDALDANHDHVATYPPGLMRYLAGTHTGLTVRIRSNANKLVNAGGNPAPDRVLLGRALACDVGLDASCLANLVSAAATVTALQKFGLFAKDGQCEFVPYWRSDRLLRYGEVFNPANAYTENEEDPVANVFVSVYRRPADRGVKAMIVIVNERDKPVREQLYIVDAQRLFGGANQLTEAEIAGRLPTDGIPQDGDWRAAHIVRKTLSPDVAGPNVLTDLEDGGTVRQLPKLKPPVDVYGPIFVPPHGMRILMGQGG